MEPASWERRENEEPGGGADAAVTECEVQAHQCAGGIDFSFILPDCAATAVMHRKSMRTILTKGRRDSNRTGSPQWMRNSPLTSGQRSGLIPDKGLQALHVVDCNLGPGNGDNVTRREPGEDAGEGFRLDGKP